MLPRLFGAWVVALALRLTYGTRVPLSPQDVAEYWAPSHDPRYALALRHLLHAFDWLPIAPERLQALDMPVLVMFGTRDRLVVPRALAGVIGAMPQGTLRMVERAGHVLPEEAPAEVNRALLEFLARGAREAPSLALGGLAR
jgi:pimeloyl-ACP methyl ester carboxylesterase